MKFSLNPATASAVNLSRPLPAPRDRVFKAWTDPAELKSWWNADGKPATIDPKVGGHVAVFGNVGKVLEVSKNEMLIFSVGGEGPNKDIETMVTVEFRKAEGGTQLTITHEGLPDAAAQEKHRSGWVDRLNRLTGHLAG